MWATMPISCCTTARPITESKGFSAEVLLGEINADDAYVVQRVLNAGATLSYVQRDEDKDMAALQRYYVHKQLYKTLLLISSAYPRTGQRGYAPRLEGPGGAPRLGGNITPQRPALPSGQVETRQLPGFVSQIGQATSEYPPARKSVTPADAPQQALQSPLSTSRDLQSAFTAHMVEALGVDPNAYEDVFGDTFGAALAAAEAFGMVQQTNRVFDRLVDEREREAQEKVDRVREQLADRPEAQTPQGADALRNAYEDVLRNLSIISLLPGGAVEVLMNRLIAELETQNGENNLTADEQELLRLVKRLMPRLAANARRNADDWQQVELDLQQESYAMPGQVVAFAQQQPGKRTLN